MFATSLSHMITVEPRSQHSEIYWKLQPAPNLSLIFTALKSPYPN